RPLSAGLMDETIPEKNGLLDRSMLESISGRSRKRQYELAGEFGLEDFGSPAGGCLLTDANYCRRLQDLFDHSEIIDNKAIALLRYGRHFRFDDKTKVIVGRHEKDNMNLDKYAGADYLRLEVPDTGSPVTLLVGTADQANLQKAAEITARYSDEKHNPIVRVICTEVGTGRVLEEIMAAPKKHRDCLI
ncbi:MAG: tRNA 4-thiouridine(8) synthase ThiI, partial [Candidatus Zixiibacteriota bacterium]